MANLESTSPQRAASGWAVAGTYFAGWMMIMIGIFQALAGLAAIIDDTLFVIGRDYAYAFDVTGWGWTHLIIGIVILLAGIYVILGKLWARIVGITLAIISAVANFLFIPYYPFWSILIIALDVFVIWALSVYGREAEV